MIVVFVVDTSPSMGLPVSLSSLSDSQNHNDTEGNKMRGMSRLDLAKMTVETLSKGLDKRIQEHNRQFHQTLSLSHSNNNNNNNNTVGNKNNTVNVASNTAQALQNIGLGFAPSDHFLLLCTGQQQNLQTTHKYSHGSNHLATATCGAGGRLLVGYGSSSDQGDLYGHQNTMGSGGGGNSHNNKLGHGHDHHSKQMFLHGHAHHDGFEQELKKLKATPFTYTYNNNKITSTITPPGASAAGGQQIPPPNPKPLPFPEDGGGAIGLNIALSTGFQLLSRHRLRHRSTENFGMGRLPSPTMTSPAAKERGGNPGAGGGPGGVAGMMETNPGGVSHALQPATLILLTDGECLTRPKHEGGGSLQLQFGNMPLREFYSEPFRWDQRFFCVNIGGGGGGNHEGNSIHPSLQALCEVTGGGHISIQSSSSLSQTADALLKMIAPLRPTVLTVPYPLRLPNLPPAPPPPTSTYPTSTFVNGGPVCSFQQMERGPHGEIGPLHRAMLLPMPWQRPDPSSFISTTNTSTSNVSVRVVQSTPPLWCIPEHYFPSKKLETLPPRPAQPLLNFTRAYQFPGINTFDPMVVMKALHRVDQLAILNKQMQGAIKQKNSPLQQQQLQQQQQQQLQQQPSPPPVIAHLLQRDVYVCKWLGGKDGKSHAPPSQRNVEHFPVLIRGATRPSLSEADDNFLNIGILHVPYSSSSNANNNMQQHQQQSPQHLSTLTCLPPEPHILLPLVIHALEAEHRVLKKALDTNANHLQSKTGATAGILHKQQQQMNTNPSRNVNLDESWRTELRAYLFRIPPYYQHALRRCLRLILPPSAHSLLNNDGMETISSQCFSRMCLQKIRTGEQSAKEANERLERQEDQLRKKGVPFMDVNINGESQQQQQHHQSPPPVPGYGQYDPRGSRSAYLAALRTMPPPWKSREDITSEVSGSVDLQQSDPLVTEILGDLPAEFLLSYYESRRRWVFGGVSLSTKGLSIDGVTTHGTNSHKYNNNHSIGDESILSIAGIGASSLNKTTIHEMGNYRERLLWSRSPVVGYEGATTAADGSILWSVDNDSLPWQFFDPATGEFSDSLQNRIKARLTVNFGNPYKDKRGDSLVPEKFQYQRPQLQKGSFDDDRLIGNESPPHDDFDDFSSVVEGEGEAVFAGKHQASPPRTPPVSPTHKSSKDTSTSDKAKLKRKASSSDLNSKSKKLHKESNSPSPRKDSAGSNTPSTPPPPPPPPQPPSQSSMGKKPKPPRPQAGSSGDQGGPVSPKSPKPPPPPPRPGNKNKPRPPAPPLVSSSTKKAPKAPPPPPPPSKKPKPPPPSKPSFLSSKIIPPPGPGIPRASSSSEKKEASGQQHQPQQQKASTNHPSSSQVPKRKGPAAAGPPPPPSASHPSSSTQKAPHPSQSGNNTSINTNTNSNINTSSTPPDAQSPHIKPKVNLPTGWISVWSKSQKRWYFFDTRTNKSVWQWPPPEKD